MNVAIILAAGESRRLGTLKQRIEINGIPLVQRAVQTARAAGLVPYVVVGAGAEDVIAAVSHATIIRNESWADGMGTSIAAGVAQAARDSAQTVTILPCDLPRVTADDLTRLVDSVRGLQAAAAQYDGVVGTPACFDSTMFDTIVETCSSDPSQGARTLLRGGEWKIALVPMPSAGFDVDTPEDLDTLRQG
jgi:CTP:molybdopterin cytidylyltransferase MocA